MSKTACNVRISSQDIRGSSFQFQEFYLCKEANIADRLAKEQYDKDFMELTCMDLTTTCGCK